MGLKLSFMGPKIWSIVLSNIKKSETLEVFKEKVRYIVGYTYHYRLYLCRLFKTYIEDLHFHLILF